MAAFRDTVGLSLNENIRAKATATNPRGTSDVSEASDVSVVVQNVPQAAPTFINSSSTVDTITLFWDALTDDASIGYSVVTSYTVYNATDDTLEPLPTVATVDVADVNADGTFSTTLTFTDGAGLTPAGNTFDYRVSATNKHGEGVATAGASQQSQKLAGPPDDMAAPVVSLSTTQVVFTWVAPNDNGEAITSYHLLIFDRINDDGTFDEYTAQCNPGTATS